jgi:4-amino-4-deoxy-L-arabinose transferase-like glycosyltransferase
MSAGSAALASVRVPAERRFRVAACALAVVAGLHGLVYVPFAGHRVGDTASYVVAAKAILHGSYTTPLPRVDVTGLKIPASAVGSPERQTYRTPGYPLLLGATGGGGRGRGAPTDAIIALQALLMGLTTFVLIFVFRRLWSDRLALIAGAVTALDPFTKHYVTRILSEVLAGFLFAVTAYAFVRAWEERSARWWAATGTAAAALTLTRPLFALAIPLLAVAALPRPRLLAALLAGFLLLLAPWLGWTAAATGRPTLSSFGEGWNLLLAAHGEGLHHTAVQVERSASYRRDFDSVHRFAPTAQELRTEPDAHPRYLVTADSEQRRLATNLYLDRLRHEPWQVAWEVIYRSYFLWEAHEDWVQPGWLLPFLRALDWVSLALAVAGGWLALRAGGAARALGIFLLVFTFVNGVHHVEARYAMPVRGLYLAFATLALFQLWARHSPRTGRNTPARTIGGVT